MFVIGTAGHVDHGKSLLVQALTGIDPDRLREEKTRGLTIDLGFAWLTLPSGREVSIVDVPGHERFIKNMLAGAGGIDLALLVIAADEGVMPQTREHLAVLDLLGIERGVLVITKRDLVDGEVLAAVESEASEALAGTTLEGMPGLSCSSVTGQGLDDLKRMLDRELDRAAPRRDIGRPRLPVDRSFTIAGFGTVVTGTLIDGSLEVGQEVELAPSGLRARIRGLQNHRQDVRRALPGSRTAVNLSGLAKDDVRRGDVLTLPGLLRPTTSIDARVRAVRSLKHPLLHATGLSLHIGCAEVSTRLLLLDCDELAPGEQAWAQLRCAEPVVVAPGDRFVLRTPDDTVAGGIIVDAQAPRHRRFHQSTLSALDHLASGSSSAALVQALRRIEPAALTPLALAAGVSEDDARRAVKASNLMVHLGDDLIMTRSGYDSLLAKAATIIGDYHREHPLRSGIPREQLRSRLNLGERHFSRLVERWADDGVLGLKRDIIAAPDFRPSLSPAEQRGAHAYLEGLEASPYAPPTDQRPGPEILAFLEGEGSVVSVGSGVVFSGVAYRNMVIAIRAHLAAHGSITLAQVRDMFGTSRRYAQAILEHLDHARVTRRVGDERVLRDRRGG
jgi:selenocysteine-specific elongation factor